MLNFLKERKDLKRDFLESKKEDRMTHSKTIKMHMDNWLTLLPEGTVFSFMGVEFISVQLVMESKSYPALGCYFKNGDGVVDRCQFEYFPDYQLLKRYLSTQRENK